MINLKRKIAGIVLAVTMAVTVSPITAAAMEKDTSDSVISVPVIEQDAFDSVVSGQAVEKDTSDIEISTPAKEKVSSDSVITGTFGKYNIEYKYSDSFFAKDPKEYDPHMATMSMNLAFASTNYVKNGDYSNGAKNVKDILSNIGFGNGENKEVFVNDGYTNKPTEDSIGCAIASKEINVGNDTTRAISITIRSGEYGKEWASNVTLGTDGEAKGFADSADKVMNCFDEFVNKYPEIKGDIDSGKVAFWVQGFSRGGAVANLTAKRLIDRYQDNNDKVYAYCLEAPQGGVASAEVSGKDYRSIHNVINKDDPVPYVAPTEMGFKRYGVDHYVNDDSSDKDNLRTNSVFGNNQADNDIDMKLSSDRLSRVEDEVRKIVNNGNIDEYKPFTITGKKLKVSLKNLLNPVSFEDTDNKDTSGCIKNILGLVANKVGRENYANKGVQDAAARLMQYLNSDVELRGFLNDIDKTDLAIKVGIHTFTNTSSDDKTWGMVKDMFYDLISGKEKEDGYKLELTEATRNNLIEGLRIHLKNNTKLAERLSAYPGGSGMAIDDIALIAKEVVNSVEDVDSLLTFGMNACGLINNHTMVQTLAWLRTADSWYM